MEGGAGLSRRTAGACSAFAQRFGRRAGGRSAGAWMSKSKPARRRKSPPRELRASTGIAQAPRIPNSAPDISVGEGSLLEYLPDAVIPYAGSRHIQRTEIRLAPARDSVLVGNSRAGQAGCGRAFRVRAAACRNRVYQPATRPVLHENFVLEPGRKTLVATARMVRILALASFCVCQEGRPPAFWRAGGRIERNRSGANPARSSRLGREHARFGRG